MVILPIHPEIEKYLKVHGIEKKFDQKVSFLAQNIRHPSLHVEVLEPKHLRIFSFRVDRKYRAIFIYRNSTTIEILSVTNHYQ